MPHLRHWLKPSAVVSVSIQWTLFGSVVKSGIGAFAVAYTGAVIDLKADETKGGKKVHQMPALNYEQAFGEVCEVIDEHPELWNRPSRDAITFAVNLLWKVEGLTALRTLRTAAMVASVFPLLSLC